jgi:DNA invertase Pin-like site-specific DNA recombinase
MTQQSEPKKQAVIYLRARCVGDNDDGVDAHLARQRAVCTRIAEQHGASVIREYEAIGGVRELSVRHVVHVMLDQAAEAHADYVITSVFDRLFRGPAKADRELLLAIRRSGATLLCGSTWDVSAPVGLDDDALAEAHRLFLAGRSA